MTNAGAALGRVLFYDKRLSANDTTSCSSCHQQKHGFSDPEKLSKGLHGKLTRRRSMGLTNARFYARGRFFWDERAATLEDQVLMPIQDEVEMGMKLDDLEVKLRGVEFYAPLFEAAFGTPEINRERISRALAQFVRSLVSYQSKYDQAFAVGGNGPPQFQLVFNQQELLGLQLFSGGPGGGGPGSRALGTLRSLPRHGRTIERPRRSTTGWISTPIRMTVPAAGGLRPRRYGTSPSVHPTCTTAASRPCGR